MIWIILIVTYLLLVAMAFGLSLEIDKNGEYEWYVHCFWAFLVGWILVPFAIAITLGKMIGRNN